MRTLATLQAPDAGHIHLDGADVLADPTWLRQRLGYLPQSINTYPGVSGFTLLDRFAWLKGREDKRQRQAEVSALLERVNLSRSAQQAVDTYSGGMLRRFGIAMALIGSPRLLIVDEPTAGLDPAERNRFHRVLADVAADAVVLLSTHIVEDVENLCAPSGHPGRWPRRRRGRPQDLCAPLAGRLWSRTVARGEAIPAAMLATAVPAGTLVVVQAEHAPDHRYRPHAPKLEDAYHAALQAAGVAAEEI
jgi:ABC-type transport system involved in cytochrome c biogenesis ATPase subunit